MTKVAQSNIVNTCITLFAILEDDVDPSCTMKTELPEVMNPNGSVSYIFTKFL